MVWEKLKNCLPENFKESENKTFELIKRNWELLAEENLKKCFYPEKLTKKGVLILKKTGNLDCINTKGIFNELKKKINSFLGSSFIQKIKFF